MFPYQVACERARWQRLRLPFIDTLHLSPTAEAPPRQVPLIIHRAVTPRRGHVLLHLGRSHLARRTTPRPCGETDVVMWLNRNWRWVCAPTPYLLRHLCADGSHDEADHTLSCFGCFDWTCHVETYHSLQEFALISQKKRKKVLCVRRNRCILYLGAMLYEQVQNCKKWVWSLWGVKHCRAKVVECNFFLKKEEKNAFF